MSNCLFLLVSFKFLNDCFRACCEAISLFVFLAIFDKNDFLGPSCASDSFCNFNLSILYCELTLFNFNALTDFFARERFRILKFFPSSKRFSRFSIAFLLACAFALSAAEALSELTVSVAFFLASSRTFRSASNFSILASLAAILDSYFSIPFCFETSNILVPLSDK